jgi:hypothetical protein
MLLPLLLPLLLRSQCERQKRRGEKGNLIVAVRLQTTNL